MEYAKRSKKLMNLLEQYLKDIYKTYKTGDATEASYYSEKTGVQQTNFSSEFWNKVNVFIEQVDPWRIIYYIYAILYSNIYREKYNEFLKIDFPRIADIRFWTNG